MTSKTRSAPGGLTGAEVAAFLAENPTFFEGRDALLLQMALPHSVSTGNGKTISLVERQVSLLRERNVAVRRQLEDLLTAARQNDEIFIKCQKLVLALIAAKDVNGFFKALEDSLKRDFKSQAYSVIIFSEYAHQINHFTSSIPAASAEEYVGGLMRSKAPYLGVLRESEQDFLFRHASAKVKSAAVLSIKGKRQLALLAIGSADPDYFRSGMGTLFISFIADVLARLLPRYVYLDPN